MNNIALKALIECIYNEYQCTIVYALQPDMGSLWHPYKQFDVSTYFIGRNNVYIDKQYSFSICYSNPLYDHAPFIDIIQYGGSFSMNKTIQEDELFHECTMQLKGSNKVLSPKLRNITRKHKLYKGRVVPIFDSTRKLEHHKTMQRIYSYAD